ncbi:hypothetical protein CJ030_MR6G007215 [Morella rubra]|uniref:GRF-type domain-containing protein n=1 Tax=Morella rubra TaxID=262757 RepID=A0A6A1V965_9ROSI|nr:hypothetical protein CJ030_MR6G007215 [Morella rubra]
MASHGSACPCGSSGSSSAIGSGGQVMTPCCYCSVEAYLKTSYIEQNFGRRFWSCVNYKLGRSCRFFHWYDPPMCVHGKRILRQLREKHESLSIEVDSHVSMAEHGTPQKNAELEVITLQLRGELSQLRSELETIKKKNDEDQRISRNVLIMSWAFFSIVMLSKLLSRSTNDESLALLQ